MVPRKESNDPDHANKTRKLALTRNFPLSDNLNLIIIDISDRPGHLNELLKSLIFFMQSRGSRSLYSKSNTAVFKLCQKSTKYLLFSVHE